MNWIDKNFGKNPFDPDYDDGYDAEKDYDNYEREMELKEMFKEGN